MLLGLLISRVLNVIIYQTIMTSTFEFSDGAEGETPIGFLVMGDWSGTW